jgi:hypothetical protein
MRNVVLGLVVGLVFVVALAGGASAQLQADVAKQLRVEWGPSTETWTRPRLVGHVYNDSTYRIGSVRLRLEILDTSNQVIGEKLAWIYIDVPARSRAYFAVPRPPGAEGFRVTVESFVLIARERLEETP